MRPSIRIREPRRQLEAEKSEEASDHVKDQAKSERDNQH
jgi:hypothetical protein